MRCFWCAKEVEDYRSNIQYHFSQVKGPYYFCGKCSKRMSSIFDYLNYTYGVTEVRIHDMS